MMRSMYAGVSGLGVHQNKMDVIGNNIANINTTGFKGSRVSFKEMMNQTIRGEQASQNNRGGINSQQIGLGVDIGSIDNNMSQGSLQSTGNKSDLAIEGDGFFVVNDGKQDFFTRNGAFTIDERGNLVNSSSGYIVQGNMAKNGEISGNFSNNIRFSEEYQSLKGQASNEVIFEGNLSSNLLGTETNTTTVDIVDSLNNKHTMSLNWQRMTPETAKKLLSTSGDTTINIVRDSGEIEINDNKLSVISQEYGNDLSSNFDTVSFDESTNAADPLTVDISGNDIVVEWGSDNVPDLAEIETEINNSLNGASYPEIKLDYTGVACDASLLNGDSISLSSKEISQETLTINSLFAQDDLVEKEFDFNYNDSLGSDTVNVSESGDVITIEYNSDDINFINNEINTWLRNQDLSEIEMNYSGDFIPDDLDSANFMLEEIEENLNITSLEADQELAGATFAFCPASSEDAPVEFEIDDDNNILVSWGENNEPDNLNELQNFINVNLEENNLSQIDLTYEGDFKAKNLLKQNFVLNDPGKYKWRWDVADVTDTSSFGGSGQISFDGTGSFENSSITDKIGFKPKDAEFQEIDVDFSNLSQNAGNFSVENSTDGYVSGDLNSFDIDSNGIINGSYTNGRNQVLGEIAVAKFKNPSGLNKEGSSLFSSSQNSGEASKNSANTGGRGEISSGSLEMSNVDLSEQFSEMITTQRGFQANSKIISTSDEMLQSLVNLKR